MLTRLSVENKTNLFHPSSIASEHREFTQDVQCKVCQRIAKNPINCKECKGLFCRNCIRIYTGENNGNCPCGRMYQEIEVEVSFRRTYNKIKILCPFKDEGCYKIILLGSYKEHFKNECEFVRIICELCGCNRIRRSYIEHYEACKTSQVTCEGCNSQLMRKDLKSHSEICPNRIMNCDHCGVSYKGIENSLHTQMCGIIDSYKERLLKVEDELINVKKRPIENLKKKELSRLSQRINQIDMNNIVEHKEENRKSTCLIF
jgi:hypothetical protein